MDLNSFACTLSFSSDRCCPAEGGEKRQRTCAASTNCCHKDGGLRLAFSFGRRSSFKLALAGLEGWSEALLICMSRLSKLLCYQCGSSSATQCITSVESLGSSMNPAMSSCNFTQMSTPTLGHMREASTSITTSRSACRMSGDCLFIKQCMRCMPAVSAICAHMYAYIDRCGITGLARGLRSSSCMTAFCLRHAGCPLA